MKNIYLIMLLFLTAILLNAQTPKWVIYNKANSGLPNNDVNAIAVDDNANANAWIGTSGGGIAMFDGTKWEVYNYANTGFSDYGNSIAIDSKGNKWIASNSGLAKFDGAVWTIYNTSNSNIPSFAVAAVAVDALDNVWVGTGLNGAGKFDGNSWTTYNMVNSKIPYDNIWTVVVDKQQNVWFGCDYGGLAKFDGTNWTIYNKTTSSIPDNNVPAVAIDSKGIKWVGTQSGLGRFNGTSWNNYYTTNSPLPRNWFLSLAVDAQDAVWIGTFGGGLVKYDGSVWTVYNTSNSLIPDNTINSITIDKFGNKWIGTYQGGMAIFNENGVITSAENINKAANPDINIYPNPAADVLHLNISNCPDSHFDVSLYNVLGELLRTEQLSKEHSILNVSDIDNGFYFINISSPAFSATKKDNHQTLIALKFIDALQLEGLTLEIE